jgi:hypothetical protein
MKRYASLLAALVLANTALGQEPATVVPFASGPSEAIAAAPSVFDGFLPNDLSNGFLTGNHNFSRFIGFVGNPLFNIDPRAVTEIVPLVDSVSVSTSRFLPDGNAQIYGPAMTVALSERLSIGMNQGGFVDSDFRKNREGLLNLGGFVQYTFLEDVPNQFLATGGMRWVAPTGYAEVFQGHGPGQLAPYVTVGKEFGEFHILATAGYQFAVGGGGGEAKRDLEIFYGNIHLDRRICGWFYPLVELNCTYHSTSVDFSNPSTLNFFSFGNFETSGNLVTLSVGANAVLIPERLELGAVYTTPIASQRDFDFNGVLVKMVIRY